MAWIEYHQELRWHYKIVRLSEDLKIPKSHALGLVSALWLWTVANAPDGNLKKFTDREIAVAADWSGNEKTFRRALRKHKLTEGAADYIHDWHNHGTRLLNLARKRIKKFRDLGRGNPDKWNAIRFRVLQRDGHACRYCGKKATTVDHVIPTTQGGASDEKNLVAACKKCNVRKNNRTPEVSGVKLLTDSPSNVQPGKKEREKEGYSSLKDESAREGNPEQNNGVAHAPSPEALEIADLITKTEPFAAIKQPEKFAAKVVAAYGAPACRSGFRAMLAWLAANPIDDKRQMDWARFAVKWLDKDRQGAEGRRKLRSLTDGIGRG